MFHQRRSCRPQPSTSPFREATPPQSQASKSGRKAGSSTPPSHLFFCEPSPPEAPPTASKNKANFHPDASGNPWCRKEGGGRSEGGSEDKGRKRGREEASKGESEGRKPPPAALSGGTKLVVFLFNVVVSVITDPFWPHWWSDSLSLSPPRSYLLPPPLLHPPALITCWPFHRKESAEISRRGFGRAAVAAVMRLLHHGRRVSDGR